MLRSVRPTFFPWFYKQRGLLKKTMKNPLNHKIKPFLKWAGGKNQLLSQFENYYPSELRQGQIKRYIEPFIGGGAVFFEMMQKYSVRSSLISDINQDLILTYQAR